MTHTLAIKQLDLFEKNGGKGLTSGGGRFERKMAKTYSNNAFCPN